MPLYHGAVDLAFITDDDAQNAQKMQYIFAYNVLPWGLPPRDLHI